MSLPGDARNDETPLPLESISQNLTRRHGKLLPEENRLASRIYIYIFIRKYRLARLNRLASRIYIFIRSIIYIFIYMVVP